MRKKTVTLTVKLTVEVKDGYDEMNAEELEGVLHRNYGLGILEYNNEICKM